MAGRHWSVVRDQKDKHNSRRKRVRKIRWINEEEGGEGEVEGWWGDSGWVGRGREGKSPWAHLDVFITWPPRPDPCTLDLLHSLVFLCLTLGLQDRQRMD